MDLSLSRSGFAVVRVVAEKIKVVEVGSIPTKPRQSHGERLLHIQEKLEELIDRYGEFTAVARERGFSRYARTTQALFKVVGVCDLTFAKHGVTSIAELPPTTIKKQLTGSGYAKKDVVAREVINLLGLQYVKFSSDDETDALAVIITYLQKEEEKEKGTITE